MEGITNLLMTLGMAVVVLGASARRRPSWRCSSPAPRSSCWPRSSPSACRRRDRGATPPANAWVRVLVFAATLSLLPAGVLEPRRVWRRGCWRRCCPRPSWLAVRRGEDSRPLVGLAVLLGLAYRHAPRRGGHRRPDRACTAASRLWTRARPRSNVLAWEWCDRCVPSSPARRSFRLLYYGHLTPNTYLLKVERVSAGRSHRERPGLHRAVRWPRPGILFALTLRGAPSSTGTSGEAADRRPAPGVRVVSGLGRR